MEVFKISNSGDFEVKTAYRILLEDHLAPSAEHHRQSHAENRIWKLTWKIKTPQNICNFVWKLMHDRQPTMQLLKNRGITDNGLCPLCNCEEESTSHLFLLCPFARACWHGLLLAVHTSDLIGISVQQWLRELIVSHEEVFMEYMQNIFITLWTIWTQRNMVVHEEKQPNPMEVVLKVQTLYCKYKEAFSNHLGSHNKCSRANIEPNTVAGNWFYGVASSKASSTNGTVQDALMEAVIIAKNYGLQRILFLTNNKNLVQLLNKSKNPAWQERSLIADLEFLYQNGLFCNLLVVPKFVLDFVYAVAKLAT
ncbi:uncharacterized protein LOC142624807 [Castanea sativa]|uniref:uncharacterized protein LOC142624807 n=1 Tax=Castanea sativa TaxID=21020 RepID=UPI003F64C224